MKLRLFTSSLMILILLGFTSLIVFADATSEASHKAAQYLSAQASSADGIGGFAFTGWALQALAANNDSSATATTFLEQHLTELNGGSTTDIERTILAVLASGHDPHNFGQKDLVTMLKTKATNNQIGSNLLVNDDLFGVIALLASGETLDTLTQGSLDYIIQSQRADGSFSWSTQGNGDSNNTAVAIETIQFARTKGFRTVDLTQAQTYLHKSQNDDGGFGFAPGQKSDAASTSWVVSAITALGQQPEVWLKNGHNPYQFLTSLQDSDGGVRWQTESQADIMTTAFAAIAFAGKALPVAVLVHQPSPEPSPSPVNSPVPSPSPSPTASPSLAPTAKPGASPSPEPTPTPTPQPTVLPTFSVQPSPSPSPSDSAQRTPSPTPEQLTSNPTPTPEGSTSPPPSAAQNLSQNPGPSPTPIPTQLPSPLATLRAVAVIFNNVDVTNDNPEDADIVEVTPLPIVQTAIPPTAKVVTTPTNRSAASPSASPLRVSEPSETIGSTIVSGLREAKNSMVGAGLMILIGIFLIGWGIARQIIHHQLERRAHF